MADDLPPCRRCGSCDSCLGLTAPDGYKVCRKCGETRPLAKFPRRRDTGGYRGRCHDCSNKGHRHLKCASCGRGFMVNPGNKRTVCTPCQGKVTMACQECGTSFVRSLERRAYCSDGCRDLAASAGRRRRDAALRQEMVDAYGGRCACERCPETNPAFLTLDHINGGGRAHRAIVGSHTYADLKRQGWPQGSYRLLCWNCNAMERLGPCPHRST